MLSLSLSLTKRHTEKHNSDFIQASRVATPTNFSRRDEFRFLLAAAAAAVDLEAREALHESACCSKQRQEEIEREEGEMPAQIDARVPNGRSLN